MHNVDPGEAGQDVCARVGGGTTIQGPDDTNAWCSGSDGQANRSLGAQVGGCP